MAITPDNCDDAKGSPLLAYLCSPLFLDQVVILRGFTPHSVFSVSVFAMPMEVMSETSQ